MISHDFLNSHWRFNVLPFSLSDSIDFASPWKEFRWWWPDFLISLDERHNFRFHDKIFSFFFNFSILCHDKKRCNDTPLFLSKTRRLVSSRCRSTVFYRKLVYSLWRKTYRLSFTLHMFHESFILLHKNVLPITRVYKMYVKVYIELGQLFLYFSIELFFLTFGTLLTSHVSPRLGTIVWLSEMPVFWKTGQETPSIHQVQLYFWTSKYTRSHSRIIV